MKTVMILKFRQDEDGVLRRVAKGKRFVLSNRGKPAARLEPLHAPTGLSGDLFLDIVRRARPSPKGKTRHADIDTIPWPPLMPSPPTITLEKTGGAALLQA